MPKYNIQVNLDNDTLIKNPDGSIVVDNIKLDTKPNGDFNTGHKSTSGAINELDSRSTNQDNRLQIVEGKVANQQVRLQTSDTIFKQNELDEGLIHLVHNTDQFYTTQDGLTIYTAVDAPLGITAAITKQNEYAELKTPSKFLLGSINNLSDALTNISGNIRATNANNKSIDYVQDQDFTTYNDNTLVNKHYVDIKNQPAVPLQMFPIPTHVETSKLIEQNLSYTLDPTLNYAIRFEYGLLNIANKTFTYDGIQTTTNFFNLIGENKIAKIWTYELPYSNNAYINYNRNDPNNPFIEIITDYSLSTNTDNIPFIHGIALFQVFNHLISEPTNSNALLSNKKLETIGINKPVQDALDLKQNITDNTLITTNKTISGSINELSNQIKNNWVSINLKKITSKLYKATLITGKKYKITYSWDNNNSIEQVINFNEYQNMSVVTYIKHKLLIINEICELWLEPKSSELITDIHFDSNNGKIISIEEYKG